MKLKKLDVEADDGSLRWTLTFDDNQRRYIWCTPFWMEGSDVTPIREPRESEVEEFIERFKRWTRKYV